MKKQFLTAIAILFMSLATNAQVGIGTTTPNTGAALDITSTNKGLLLPRVANTAAIASPVNGMMIYDLSSNCFKAYQNNIWSDCGLLAPVTDQIQAALTTSQAAYIAAPANSWIAVTATEYAAVLAGVTGAASYGTSSAVFNTNYAGFPTTNTMSLNPTATVVPASSYPIAMSFKAATATTSTGQLKFGATVQNTFNNYGGALPSFTTTTFGINYFVIKAPTTTLASNGYIALYTSAASIGIGAGVASTVNYYAPGDLANGSNMATYDGNGYQPQVQVISTSTKTW